MLYYTDNKAYLLHRQLTPQNNNHMSNVQQKIITVTPVVTVEIDGTHQGVNQGVDFKRDTTD